MVMFTAVCRRWPLARWYWVVLLWLPICKAESGQAVSSVDRGRPDPIRADFVLQGGTLIDGTGAPARQADVAVAGGKIVAVGRFAVHPETRFIDMSSHVVAPGFIDLHSHSDSGITQPSTRLNQNYLTQGVTTIVTGNCGLGVSDVAKYLATIDAHGAGTNVIHLIPHGTVRSAVMGNAERPPTPTELERMIRLVERGMEAGAWGLSTGLIYVPGRYADTAELVALSERSDATGGSTPRTSATKAPGYSNRLTRRSQSVRKRASRCTFRT